jgi:hypothetical protein
LPGKTANMGGIGQAVPPVYEPTSQRFRKYWTEVSMICVPSNSILAVADLLVDTKEVIPVCSLLVHARTGSPLLSASAQL